MAAVHTDPLKLPVLPALQRSVVVHYAADGRSGRYFCSSAHVVEMKAALWKMEAPEPFLHAIATDHLSGGEVVPVVLPCKYITAIDEDPSFTIDASLAHAPIPVSPKQAPPENALSRDQIEAVLRHAWRERP
jgi:hypothetical protein